MAALLETLESEAKARHLEVLGAFHPSAGDLAPEGAATILLIGPDEPSFWPHFQASTEFCDSQPDPLDHWSKRVLGDWAAKLGAAAIFPSDGPPYAPFVEWAKATARIWNSPTGVLVHDTAGLMVSFRGALALRELIPLSPSPPCPCFACTEKPCLTACPVAALSDKHAYNVPACKSYLDTSAGRDCMMRGCAVRRSCPISQTHGRAEVQSAFHMRSFHPAWHSD